MCGCGGARPPGAADQRHRHRAASAARWRSRPARSAAAARHRRGHPPRPLEARPRGRGRRAGDAVALDIIARALRAFAAAIVSIVNMFDPDRVIVGGGIAMAWGERLLGPARDAVAAHGVPASRHARVRIVPAALGDDVGLIGRPLVASVLPAVVRPIGHAAAATCPAHRDAGARSA